jgi:hypothetical protein
MLKAMSELEKAVDDLLDRMHDRPGRGPSVEKISPGDEDEGSRSREREAAELVRRTLKRLKSL